MWSSFDCFICCKKLLSKSSQDSYNLNEKGALTKNNSQGRSENYQVRRVSRVAGTTLASDQSDIIDSYKKRDGNEHNPISKKVSREPRIRSSKDKNDSGLCISLSEESINLKESNESIKNSPTQTPELKGWQKMLQDKGKAIKNKKHQFSNFIHPRKSDEIAKSSPDLSNTEDPEDVFKKAPPKPKRKNASPVPPPEFFVESPLETRKSYVPPIAPEEVNNKLQQQLANKNSPDNQSSPTPSRKIINYDEPKQTKKAGTLPRIVEPVSKERNSAPSGIEERPKVEMPKPIPTFNIESASPTPTPRKVSVPSPLPRRRGASPGLVADRGMVESQSLSDLTQAQNFGLDLSLYPKETNKNVYASTPSDLHQPVSAGNTRSKEKEPVQEMCCGTVHFAACYDAGKLSVHVNFIEDLPWKDDKMKYPVILRIAILTDDGKAVSSKTSKTARDSHPCKFNEDFELPLESSSGLTLRISVCDSSNHGKYDAVGHALLSLDDANIEIEPRVFKKNLYKQSEPCKGNSGILYATLMYDRREKKLCVIAMQCKELVLGRGTKALDKYATYIKASLYTKGKKIKSKTSEVVTKDHFYNHEFKFTIGPETLSDSCLVLSAMLKGRLMMDTLIGKVILGPHFYSNSTTMTPWGRVVLGQQTASHWYKLYI